MLAFEKIQTEYLKQNIKRATKGGGYSTTDWMSAEYENICCLCNGVVMVIIPKSLCFVDCNHNDARHFDHDLIHHIMLKAEESHPIVDTGMEFTNNRGDKVRVFHDNEDDRDIHLNAKRVEHFTKIGCSFQVNGQTHMVFPYLGGDKPVGCIMEIKTW